MERAATFEHDRDKVKRQFKVLLKDSFTSVIPLSDQRLEFCSFLCVCADFS